MHKFFHFAHLKSTFSILHTYFCKTPTTVCLLYTFIQIKYSFLYPHNHRPTPTIHIGITLESTQPTCKKPEKQTQQNGSKPTPESTPHLEQNGSKWYYTGIDALPWATRLTPPVVMARTRNKIDASKGKRWRWRETFNPKPTDQVHSTQKQRETKEEKAIGGGSGDGNQRKLEEERLMRGRKIDQMRGRKKELCAWEREGAES